MRGFSILIFASIGFVGGCILGVALDGGFENPINSLGMGLLGAVAFAIVQCILVFPSRESYYTRRTRALQRRNRRPRQETEGSFGDRMERFAANVQRTSQDNKEQSKMSLWIAEECNDLEPSPPKPIGIIRMLLHRIRSVLTGK